MVLDTLMDSVQISTKKAKPVMQSCEVTAQVPSRAPILSSLLSKLRKQFGPDFTNDSTNCQCNGLLERALPRYIEVYALRRPQVPGPGAHHQRIKSPNQLSSLEIVHLDGKNRVLRDRAKQSADLAYNIRCLVRLFNVYLLG